MEKEQYRESKKGLKISHLSFQIPNMYNIQRQSHLHCVNKTLYDDTQGGQVKRNRAAPFGVLDARLGKL